MKKNAGVTLIELIVVILIMGILTSGATISLARMHDSDVDGAAGKLVSILTQARSQSVTKSQNSIWFELKCDSDGCTAYIYQGDKSNPSSAAAVDSEKICGSSVSIKYTTEDSLGNRAETTLASGNSIQFNFAKPTGKISEDYTDIKICGTKDINIIVIKETGRCLIEK